MCVGAWQNAETILVAFSDEFGVATLDDFVRQNCQVRG